MAEQHPYHSGYQELTLGEILREVGRYAKLVLKKWWVILLLSLLMGGAFYYQESQITPTYRGEMTFTLNDDSGGGSALGGIFGRAAGLGGSGQNLEKIVELGKSQLIIQQVLLDSAEVDGRSDRLAHHVMEAYDYPTQWAAEGPGSWATVRFGHTKVDSMDLAQRQVLQFLYRRMVFGESRLVRFSVRPVVGIIALNGESIAEELTQVLIEKTFTGLSQFYIDKSVSGPRRNYEILRTRTDSLKRVIDGLQYQIARSEDVSGSVFRSQDQLRLNRLRQELMIAQTAYGQVLTRTGEAEFVYRNVTPYFSVIDRPFLPLGKKNPKTSEQFLIGAFLGTFLAVFALVLYFIIRNALRGKASGAPGNVQ